MGTRRLPLRTIGAIMTLAVLACGAAAPARDRDRKLRTSADWLGLLPDGEVKRRFVLDCTGCHLFDEAIARSKGGVRTRAVWQADVGRMIRMAGATTGFPVIAHDRDSTATAAWLDKALARAPRPRTRAPASAIEGAVTEFELPEPRDLPHDLAIGTDGRVVITGMFTDRLYVLDPGAGRSELVTIPVPRANPRAIEIDSTGAWWVAMGAPRALARYARGEWRTYPIGWYPHSLAIGRSGVVWANGHFTRDPELIARITAASGARDTFAVPAHPTLAKAPGGPIPYELRVAPDGRVWGSELQGNRIFVLDPVTSEFEAYAMPVSHSGPRRFDIDREGVLWIPAYAANELVRFEPRTRTFERFPLPIPDAVPYVVRVDDGDGRVWIGTAAADAVLAFDIATARFTVYPLPSPGAMIRHLAVDPRTHEVWAAYGASPSPLGARVARIRPAASP